MTSQADKKIMRHSHSSKEAGAQGASLIERIERQMDKRRKSMETFIVDNGSDQIHQPAYQLDRGRYEGLAAALSILRSSSMQQEVSRSNDRLGIE